jgi:hypothetical protein
MNFGFVTGDDSIDDAYFYATAYPQPDGWSDLDLPDGASWRTEGWTGAILPYAALADSGSRRHGRPRARKRNGFAAALCAS